MHGKELKNTGYEIFVGILSILSIVNILRPFGPRDQATAARPLRPGCRSVVDQRSRRGLVQACLSAYSASSSNATMASSRASAMLIAPDITRAVPTIGATATRTFWASSSVTPVSTAAPM